MTRLIHTIALAAAAVVLATGLWQGWGLWATSRRLLLAYLGFFFLSALLALAVRLVPLLDKPAPVPEEKGRRRRGRKAEPPATEA
ncbi:MAG: hypothetical protein R6X35_16710 [Candidatus Krumholzibacteriia bacterium]